MRYLQKNHSIAGFTLSESLYPPLLKQSRHTHLHASFSFVLSGKYVENYGNKIEERQSSTVVFHPPQESHAVDFQSGTRILNVMIDSKRFDYLREHCIVFDSSASSQTETIARLGNKIYQEFCRMDSVSAIAIEGLILEILAEASRNKISASERKSPRWLSQVTEFLHSNFSEPATLDAIAKIADVHPVHLARVFRQKYDCTIGEYVRRCRMEFARKQISDSEYPLNEIALAAGFTDQSHFTRTFKAHLGMTPGEYRKISRSC